MVGLFYVMEITHRREISDFDMQALKRLMEHFGANDKTALEHMAYDVLKRIVEPKPLTNHTNE